MQIFINFLSHDFTSYLKQFRLFEKKKTFVFKNEKDQYLIALPRLTVKC